MNTGFQSIIGFCYDDDDDDDDTHLHKDKCQWPSCYIEIDPTGYGQLHSLLDERYIDNRRKNRIQIKSYIFSIPVSVRVLAVLSPYQVQQYHCVIHKGTSMPPLVDGVVKICLKQQDILALFLEFFVVDAFWIFRIHTMTRQNPFNKQPESTL